MPNDNARVVNTEVARNVGAVQNDGGVGSFVFFDTKAQKYLSVTILAGSVSSVSEAGSKAQAPRFSSSEVVNFKSQVAETRGVSLGEISIEDASE